VSQKEEQQTKRPEQKCKSYVATKTRGRVATTPLDRKFHLPLHISPAAIEILSCRKSSKKMHQWQLTRIKEVSIRETDIVTSKVKVIHFVLTFGLADSVSRVTGHTGRAGGTVSSFRHSRCRWQRKK
jgi:hypothetical protein